MELIYLGKEQALRRYATEWWIGKSAHEIALTQLQVAELICPWDVFQGALESALGHPVWTHELASEENISHWFEQLTKEVTQ